MTKGEVLRPKSIVEYLRAMQAHPIAVFDEEIFGMAADEIDRLTALLDKCEQATGFITRLPDEPETPR